VRNWRVLTAVAAVVLAAAASVLAYTYLTQADARAQTKTELVPALVARSNIPKGTPGKTAVDENLFEVKQVPRNVLPDGSMSGNTGLSGLVAVAQIPRGQIIVHDSFVAPSQVNGFSTTIKDGLQAISFSVDQTHGVAGFIQPNDSIDLLYTVPLTPSGLKTTAYLIPGLQVLAVGNTTASANQSQPQGTNGATATTQAPAQSSGIITVEVNPRQAEQIAHAENDGGTMTLTLNPPNFNAKDFKTPQEIVETYNLFDQPLTYAATVAQQVNNAKH
jgi:pilus assembly protein CpaB